jgi:hypothetical protein
VGCCRSEGCACCAGHWPAVPGSQGGRAAGRGGTTPSRYRTDGQFSGEGPGSQRAPPAGQPEHGNDPVLRLSWWSEPAWPCRARRGGAGFPGGSDRGWRRGHRGCLQNVFRALGPLMAPVTAAAAGIAAPRASRRLCPAFRARRTAPGPARAICLRGVDAQICRIADVRGSAYSCVERYVSGRRKAANSLQREAGPAQ